MKPEMLDVIALNRDVVTSEDVEIKAGTAGTVVFVYDDGAAYEVEFGLNDGLVTAKPNEIHVLQRGRMTTLDGLPPDGAEGEFIGFNERGRVVLLYWHRVQGRWYGLEFEDVHGDDGRPRLMRFGGDDGFRETSPNYIVSHANVRSL